MLITVEQQVHLVDHDHRGRGAAATRAAAAAVAKHVVQMLRRCSSPNAAACQCLPISSTRSSFVRARPAKWSCLRPSAQRPCDKARCCSVAS